MSRTGRLARVYDRLTAPLERRALPRWRGALWALVPTPRSSDTADGTHDESLENAAVAGLEVGVGTGANLPYYPWSARVVATDVSWAMLREARQKLGVAEPPRTAVWLVVADAARLPFRDGTFGWVVATLVFCEVRDPVAGLAEVARVLGPRAPLFMLEHVRPRGWLGRVADLLTQVTGPLWGEHLNRDAAAAARRAGFDIEREIWLWRDVVTLLQLHAQPGEAGSEACWGGEPTTYPPLAGG